MNQCFNDKRTDYITGQAGLIKSLCELNLIDEAIIEDGCHRLKKSFNSDKKWWQSKDFPNPTLGLSHGYSGYALAFGLAGKKLKKQEYVDFAIELLQEEDSYHHEDENHMYWPDLRISPDCITEAWCHGSAGILLARAKLFQTTGEEIFLKNIDIAIKNIEAKLTLNFNNYDDVQDISLCHGTLGLIESLRFASHIPSIKEKISLNYEQFYKKIMHLIFDKNYKLGIPLPVHSSGFMTGMSGIMCAFIKYFEPHNTLDILI